MNLNRKPSKFWIYFPLYVALIYAIVRLFWAFLNPADVPVQVVPEPEPAPVVEVIDISCFNSYCQDLSGIFRLWPDDKIRELFKELDEECVESVCDYCTAQDKTSPESYVFEDPCMSKVFESAYNYHNEQLKSLPLIKFFYNSGERKLTEAQVLKLTGACESFKSREYGAVIIGRASKIGNIDGNAKISKARAQFIQSVIQEVLGENFKCDYEYFGAKPPQLTQEIAQMLNIPINEYENINVGKNALPDYSLRLNQSALVVFYPLGDDVFGLGEE